MLGKIQRWANANWKMKYNLLSAAVSFAIAVVAILLGEHVTAIWMLLGTVVALLSPAILQALGEEES